MPFNTQEPDTKPSIKKADLEDPTLFKLNQLISLIWSKIAGMKQGGDFKGATTFESIQMPPTPYIPRDNDVVPFGVIKKYFSPQAIKQSLVQRNWLGAPVRPVVGVDSASNTSAFGVSIVDTHANRLALYGANSYDVGTLFYESDRTSMYEVHNVAGTNEWVWIGGCYYDVIANQPTDLATTDEGFLFTATDGDLFNYRWDGAAFQVIQVNAEDARFTTSLTLATGGSAGDVLTNDGSDGAVWQAPSGGGGVYKNANASASMTLTTSFADVTGASVSLDQDGTWMVVGDFVFYKDINDDECQGQLVYDGSAQTGIVRVGNATLYSMRGSCSHTWFVTVTSQPKTAKLQVKKNAGTGASTSDITNTGIRAVFLG